MLARMRLALVVWLAMVGLDFALNAGLFAYVYQEGGGFMLEPAEAFRRIPLGYLAFLIVAVGAVELAVRLEVRTVAAGLRFGLAAGAALAATWTLGLYSVATLTPQMAAAFGVIWLMLLTLAGGVAAAGLSGTSLRDLTLRVVAADVVCVIAVIALQTFGVVPTLKL
jgi:hypothetical protein